MPDLAWLLVEDARYPDPAGVIASGKRLGLAMKLSSDREPQVFEVEGTGTLMVSVMPVPDPDVPKMPFGPMSPDPEVARAAKAHIIVAALDLTGPPRVKDTKLALLATTIIENTRAVGVKLHHGVMFQRADLFARMAALALDEGVLPAEIAIDVTTARESETRMSFLTHGMERYGREELYVTCPVRGKRALDFVLQLVRWMLDDPNKQFATGETIGRSAEEKIEIQRVANPAGGEGKRDVMRLDLGLD
jgi:hypothetical protein